MPKKPEIVKLPKGAGKAPGTARLTMKRKGPRKLDVEARVDIGGNLVDFSIKYHAQTAPTELLDLFEVQYQEAIDELQADGVTTADEAFQFFMRGFDRLAKTNHDNEKIIVEED